MDANNAAARTRPNSPTRAFSEARAIIPGAICAIAGCLLAGCHGGVQTDLLERELRLQEDRIYELEDHLADCQNVIKTYREENGELRRRIGASPEVDAAPRLEKPRRRLIQPRREPKLDSPETIPEIDIAPPVIEEEDNGVLDSLEGDTAEDPSVQSGDTIELLPGPTPAKSVSAAANVGPPELLPIPAPVDEIGPIDRIVLQRMLAVAEAPAPIGRVLRAVVEPRDADGRPIRTAGNISLMIRDPEAPEPESKIGRWDYALDETKSMWRRSGLGSGLHFDIHLPPSVENRTYELWARWMTSDGEKFLERVEFEVVPIADALPSLAAHASPTGAAANEEASRETADRRIRDADESESARDVTNWTPSSTAAKLAATKNDLPKGETDSLDPPWKLEIGSPPISNREASRGASAWSPYR